MTSATLLLIAAGSLALMIGCIAILLVARNLDGSSGAGSAKLSEQIEKTTATLHAVSRSASKWSPGPLGAALSALAAESGDASKKPTEDNKTVKQIITGIAIAGGIIALVIGVIAGDG